MSRLPDANSRGDKLDRYRQKRVASQTPEPFGGQGLERPRLFTVQKHAARRVHYDLRLEHGGVLWSWAVPKGPSFDPDDKRLAVHVEDHPVEYADFEGVIPEGNYGAGGVIVWDKGSWTPLEDPDEGLKKGKLVFLLHGHKLRGEWTLVRTKRKDGVHDKEWLLIKHRDAYAGKGTSPSEASILSGRSVEDVASGHSGVDAIRAALKKAKAPQRAPAFDKLQPMLAESRARPFDDPAWLFELKYDGYRLMVSRGPGRVVLRYRGGEDVAALFPDLGTALAALPGESAILDGELTVLDDRGHPSFRRLQQRTRLRRAVDIAHATVEYPATLYVFDLLAFEDFDLRPLPLATRKSILRQLLTTLGPLRYADHVEGDGVAFFEAVNEHGLEGVMAKRADSPYRVGRSDDWLKIRAARHGDFAVVGYTISDRRPFSALHLAFFEQDRFVYCGRVGGGFTEAQLESIRARLDAARRKTPIFDPRGPQPEGKGHVWCDPELVVEVRYRDWVETLRMPTFMRLREDKTPKDCVRDDLRDEPRDGPPGPVPTPEPIAAEERTVAYSHRDKLFWPEDGLTKGDLIDYYLAVAPFMLPYLRDRPVVLTRYPDGIGGKSFFQKDAPSYVPPWLRTERMWSEHAQREIDYFVCDDAPSLAYVINLGTIPVHVWSSRVRSLPTPDWCILDLDPKDAPFSHVVTLARAIHALCDEIELPSYCKTSGSTGLHVLVPLGRAFSYEQSKTLGGLLCNVIAGEHPDLATVERVLAKRGGRVYLDYLQNGHGKTIVSPYSARPLPGAPVSMPLKWREVTARLDPRQYTLRNARARLDRLGVDPMVQVIDELPRLDRVLERLSVRVARLKPTQRPKR